MKLNFPWPDPKLSPNARGHWAQTAKLKKRQRDGWAWHATAQGIHGVRDQWTPEQIAKAVLKIRFNPPSKRAYDLDNRLASIKAGIDGLADVLRCDDKGWQYDIAIGVPVPGGSVTVEMMQP